jgi:hypothetical protein
VTVANPFHDFKPGEPAPWKALCQNKEQQHRLGSKAVHRILAQLEEGDNDAAAAQSAEVLRKAFAKAKREHPGKQVRLSFEK